MKVLIKILKIILGVIFGLALSFITVVCLDAVLSDGNPFDKDELNLWAIAPIVAGWLFLILWLLLRRSKAKEIKTQGLEHLPKSISELIDSIIDAMQYRKGVRAEVRQELTDHFIDALRDCDDEQQKQECIHELIEGFGDVELLGKLLRRAKKRCRPLWRTAVVRMFQFIGVCFLLLILYIGWFFTGKPSITTNYVEKMNQMVRPVAEDNQNAWPLYEQAAQTYVEPAKVKIPPSDKEQEMGPMEPYGMVSLSPGEEDFDQSPRKLELLSEQERRILKQWILDNQKPLELIRQGNQHPYYWQVYETGEHAINEMMAVLLPHMGEYRDLARLMCWQGLVDAESGNYAQVLDHILETYLLGQHLRGQHTTLIEQLVAMAIKAISINTMRMILDEHGNQIDAAVLDSARKRFSKMIANEDYKVDFGGEKLFMYDEAQRCFTTSRFGKSHLYFPRLQMLVDYDVEDQFAIFGQHGFRFLFTHPDKEETLREVEKFYSEMEQVAAMTPASANAQGLDMHVFTEEEISKNIFLDLLMPALYRVNQVAYRTRIDVEATLAILAIFQYQKQQGQLPETQYALVEKGLLKEVPIDPFSDKRLVYRRTDDGFILYSVGYNFTDDGGKPCTDDNGKYRTWGENGDRIFWPVESVNSDR